MFNSFFGVPRTVYGRRVGGATMTVFSSESLLICGSCVALEQPTICHWCMGYDMVYRQNPLMSKDDPHRQLEWQEEHYKLPLVEIDFAFLKTKEDQQLAIYLNIADKNSGAAMPVAVKDKSCSAYVVQYVLFALEFFWT